MEEIAESAKGLDSFYMSKDNLKLVAEVMDELNIDDKRRKQLGCFTSGETGIQCSQIYRNFDNCYFDKFCMVLAKRCKWPNFEK